MPYGATVLVADGEKVKAREQLVVWDPHITPILAEKGGIVRYEDIEEGETARLEEERKGGAAAARPSSSSSSTRASATRASPSKATTARSSTSTTCPPRRVSKSRTARRSRPASMLARQPKEVGRHDGHHRRSAARHGNLRGPQAEGPGRAGRNLRHGRAALATSVAAR